MSETNRSNSFRLRETVKQTLLNECVVKRGANILLGVSGGSDSMALMHVLSTLQDEVGFNLYAVGINHNLRPEAAHELDIAYALAKSLLVPFYKKSIFIS